MFKLYSKGCEYAIHCLSHIGSSDCRSGFFPLYKKPLLHLTFLGGFSLMIFSVGTMVVLSHGGESAKLQRPLLALRIIGIGILLALSFRLGADFFRQNYFQWLGIGAAFWILAGTSWLCFITPKIFKVPEAETFEHAHEEMKARVSASS